MNFMDMLGPLEDPKSAGTRVLSADQLQADKPKPRKTGPKAKPIGLEPARTLTEAWGMDSSRIEPHKARSAARTAYEAQRDDFERKLPDLLREMADNPKLVAEIPPPPELIRNYLVNRLLVESMDAETKHRLRALELLGKLQYVSAFTGASSSENTSTASAQHLEAKLRDKLKSLVAQDVPAIDLATVKAAREQASNVADGLQDDSIEGVLG